LSHSKQILGQRLGLVSRRSQFNCRCALWRLSRDVYEDSFGREPITNHPHDRNKVRVSTDEDELIAPISVCVVKHVDGDIHIRPLFFFLLKKAVSRRTRAGSVAAFDLFELESAEDYFDPRKRCQGREKDVLIRAGWSCDLRREITDLKDVIEGAQE
jgi:hypothetical protein